MTRHNLGELIVRGFARELSLSFKEESRLKGLVARGRDSECEVHLLIPTTYMNESGQAARRYLDYYKLPVSSVIVVTDDTAIPFGQFRLREKGSPGGHNGLKSIELHLGTQDYIRLRAGIGSPRQEQPLESYVLEPFRSEEQSQLPKVLADGTQILKELIREETSTVMNRVNVRSSKQMNKEPQAGTGEQSNDRKTKDSPL